MKISLSGESKKYAPIIFDILRIFLPELTWQELISPGNINEKDNLLDIRAKEGRIQVSFNNGPFVEELCTSKADNDFRRKIKLAVYKLFVNELGYLQNPWGILTGIRPTKIAHRLWDQGMSYTNIKDYFSEEYFLSEDKTVKLLEITQLQRKYLPLKEQDNKQVSIYVSIPFCPTRCFYCSFPAFSLTKWGHLVDDYLNNLLTEITAVSEALKKKNLTVQTIYVGGGTPTTLNHKQLSLLLQALHGNFYSGETREFTVEAGRPDTIDEEKLAIMKEWNVERISINPQTMWEPTLQKIGRHHTINDVKNSIALARKIGFKVINMDLIIGLPGENPNTISYTLKQLEEIMPENLTLHALALKRSSVYKEKGVEFSLPTEPQKMFQLAEDWCRSKGYQPYYLYRQKQIVSNLENVGYCLPGHPSLYNIQMIEERQTIWGLGVGAGSKIVNHDLTLLNKYNPKDLLVYNERIGEIIGEKVDKIKGLS